MERVLLGGARASNRGCGASALEAARAIVDEDPLRTYTVRRWTVNEGSYTVKVNYCDQSVTID